MAKKTSPSDLAEARSLAAAAADEIKRRHKIASFTAEGGLFAFVRYFWSILEPTTQLVEGWPMEAICEHLEAVSRGEVTRLLINVPPGFSKSLITNVFWPAWEWAVVSASMRYVTFSYAATLTERDNGRFRAIVLSDTYRELFPHIILERFGDTKIANTLTGWKFASSIEGVGTGERGDRVLLDDPNRVGESKLVLENTARWFRQAMLNRLNDQKKSAIVVIMQRIHELDISGTILSAQMPYVHLNVPMEFDPKRACETLIGWSDPRVSDGELAWPERFPLEEVDRLKKDLGPTAYCTPAESPVLMADLSLKPIGEVQVGDMVVGFTGDTEQWERRTTKKVRVLAKSQFKAPVVRILLSSGETIRCTPDHNWYMGKEGGRRGHRTDGTADMRPLYREAIVGRRLMRVCPPRLPQLSSQQERDAGWLAGFFDGEGSVIQQNRHGLRPSSHICFFQTAGRNLPLCEKLERVLTELGFNYVMYLRVNNPTYKQEARHYRVTGRRLLLAQKFLHVVQPAKWRDRLLEGAYGSSFIVDQERVISIEPDGEEEVFGLTTESGNYVVWGLASSNSGQYSQSPAPVGGGIIPAAWWKLWESSAGTFPPVDFICASLDGAFTAREENDPSALTIWGVWTETHEGVKRRRVVLMSAWRKFLPFSGERATCDRRPNESLQGWRWRTRPHWGLMEWVKDTCEERRANVLLIEAKGPGISAAQELRNRFGDLSFGIQLVQPKGDKIARVLACQPLFSQGVVYAPDREYAQLVIDELEVFPKGARDDLCDSSSQALKWLRDSGLLASDEEVVETMRRSIMHHSPQKPIYPC